MIPDLASVMRKRYRMERNIRFMGLVLFVLWIVYCGHGIIQGISELLAGWGLVTILEGMIASLPLLLGALFLGILSGRIARWILPIPKTGCPRCGYRLVALVEPRCPECGLDLPRELMGP